MKKKKKIIDSLRLLALISVLLAIIHFYLTIISPGMIPYCLRTGMPDRPMNILLMGTDNVFDSETHKIMKKIGHNDTIMLAHINPRSDKISFLSIPRDTLAEIPGYGRTKINAASFIGGPKLAVETISRFLGIEIDGYVALNPMVSIQMVDAIGGIKVYVDKDMYYVDKAGGLFIDLKKGWHELSGEQANGYLRFRMDPLGDINRIQRQQEFASLIMKKIAIPQNIWRIPFLAGIVKENIKTNIAFGDILRLGNFARCIKRENISSMLVPGDFSAESDKPCFWMANSEETEKILQEHFSKKSKTATKQENLNKSYYIAIFNNSEDKNAILPILKQLNKSKYVVSNIIMTKREDYSKTKIIAQKGDIESGKALGRLLGINDVVVSSGGDIISDFTIILTEDYNGSLSKTP